MVVIYYIRLIQLGEGIMLSLKRPVEEEVEGFLDTI